MKHNHRFSSIIKKNESYVIKGLELRETDTTDSTVCLSFLKRIRLILKKYQKETVCENSAIMTVSSSFTPELTCTSKYKRIMFT